MSRSAIVTGAAAGMGAKIAQLLGERGYHLTLLDLDGVALEATAQRM
jgi:short-subunit dehydrogenase